jgi:hypothetical protein
MLSGMKSIKINTIKIKKVYVNSRTKQQFLILPRKKMKESIEGKKIEVRYW